MKVVAFFPEPTPYRAPLLDRIAAHEDVDLLVLYTAPTVAGRSWDVQLHHAHDFLGGVTVPGARRVLRHDYWISAGVGRRLDALRPDVVVVSGWSTYASQAAMWWCRRRHVPYLVVVESHDRDRRAGWRRAVKRAIVPRLLSHSAGALVTGKLARESMLRAGVPADRIWRFANTVDTRRFAEQAAELAPRRDELRASLGVGDRDVVALSVARLISEKALDIFLRSAEGVTPVLAGDGPLRPELARAAPHAVFVGDVPWERIVELYVAADVFVLVSRHEPWGVVVNEASACGLPLVLSDHVGAAPDLLEPGRNGELVPVGDVEATRAALERLAADRELRRRYGERSSEIARGWGYEASVEGFLSALAAAG